MMLGLIPGRSAEQLEADRLVMVEEAKALEDGAVDNDPLLSGLSGHVRKRWEAAKDAKVPYEQRMLECMRQRNGEYDPDKLSEIRRHGGSELFIHLTSTKCRGASSWLRDTLLGNGADKPWTIKPTPIPDLPPDVQMQMQQELQLRVETAMRHAPNAVTPDMVKEEADMMKSRMRGELESEARQRVERMEQKMEDQLVEGGFHDALNQFIDDIVTFPVAVLKGPVLRKRTRLQWVQGGVQPAEVIRPEWERIDPFNIYPAPWATGPDDGYLIERHKLNRRDLEMLIGVEGFDEPTLREVLKDFDRGLLREWLSIDSEIQSAAGNTTSYTRDTELVDALQLWDDIPGHYLREWGMSEQEVPDETAIYACDVWLVGSKVIKATLNYDPLNRKPYYVASYEQSPGSFYGKGVAELVRDVQSVCNAAARSLVNNMGMASGPQVGVNLSRLPPDQKLDQMYPWKIWQFTLSDYGDTTPPITYFQPQSHAQELMMVFDHFSKLADEYSGIPRYMTGEHTPGAGRTASGLSMLINNAGKSIKQVIANIDALVLTKLLERLYHYNLRYTDDPDLVGDINILARGASSLVAKEAAAVRRNEFLQLALSSPVAQQVVGLPGIAELMRESAKSLDMPVDHIVPPREEVERTQQQQQQMMMQEQAMQSAGGKPGANLHPDGSRVGGRPQNTMVNHMPGATG